MQLLSACGERDREKRVNAIFDLVPLDEALRWSLGEAAGKLQGR